MPPSPSRSRSRIRLVLQLVFLLALPVTVLASLFGMGVYLGEQHRETVLSFERDVLRMDVDGAALGGAPVPGLEGVSTAKPGSFEPGSFAPRSFAPGPASPPAAEVKPLPPAVDPKPAEGSKTPAAGAPPAEAGATRTDPKPDGTGPVAAAEGKGEGKGEGASAYPGGVETPPTAAVAPPSGSLSGSPGNVRVQVKILVGRELIKARPNWIGYAQRLAGSAAEIYQASFQLEFVVFGITTWDVPSGLRSDALLDDLRGRPREGADILIGLTVSGDEPGAHGHGRGDRPLVASPVNGAYAVVRAGKDPTVPHLRPLLHQLGHIFGAVDVADKDSDAYRRGSWMNVDLGGLEGSPWVDVGSRKTITDRRSFPFAPEPGRTSE